MFAAAEGVGVTSPIDGVELPPISYLPVNFFETDGKATASDPAANEVSTPTAAIARSVMKTAHAPFRIPREATPKPQRALQLRQVGMLSCHPAWHRAD